MSQNIVYGTKDSSLLSFVIPLFETPLGYMILVQWLSHTKQATMSMFYTRIDGAMIRTKVSTWTRIRHGYTYKEL